MKMVCEKHNRKYLLFSTKEKIYRERVLKSFPDPLEFVKFVYKYEDCLYIEHTYICIKGCEKIVRGRK